MVEAIPQEIEVKPAFEERYRSLLGQEYDEFMKYSLAYIRKAIRVNTLKISIPDLVKRLEKRWKLTPVPWCREGFWIEGAGDAKDRYDLGNLLEHMLGYIYVQDPSSMIPPVVLLQDITEDVNLSVLDLCASPGSKASQLAALMQNKGVLVANDIKTDRIKPLGMNLQRCGVSNTIISMMYGQNFARKSNRFDRVLVDAPCSGTGTIRRSLKTLRMWSPHMVRKISKEQKKLIDSGFKVLKKGGVLVYSTCTQEPEENEGVVSWLLQNHADACVESFNLNIKRSRPVLEFDGDKYDDQVKDCLRIYPQDNDTEGFFVCRIRKSENF